jgi:hypothetical protein
MKIPLHINDEIKSNNILETVNYLINTNDGVQNQEVLVAACSFGNLELIKEVTENELINIGLDLPKALSNANTIPVVSFLLDKIKQNCTKENKVFNVQKVTENVLFWSALNSNYVVTQYLLEQGANPKVLLDGTNTLRVQEWTKKYLLMIDLEKKLPPKELIKEKNKI